MLKSFGIRGYRQFTHLDIPELGRMNLITGRNNVGKTSLLEAIRLYKMTGSGYALLDILQSRDEHLLTADSPVDVDETREEILDFSYLFSRRFSSQGQNRFSLGPLPLDHDVLSITLRPYDVPLIKMETVVEPDMFNESFATEQAVLVEFNNALRERIFVERPTRFIRSQLKRKPESEESFTSCIYVPSSGVPPRVLNAFWDRIALTSAESDVIEALRIIDPRIERISFVGVRHSRITRIPVVKLRGMDTPIPIKNLGDGMSHAFTCVLALVTAKDGTLLIDEIESGLHFSVQLQLWRLIIGAAEELNVQVFATSHSWDCIEAFQKATLEKETTDGVLIRLNSNEGNISATVFEENELRIATRERIEVR